MSIQIKTKRSLKTTRNGELYIQLNSYNSNPQEDSKFVRIHEFSNYRSLDYFGQILKKISRGCAFTM